MPATAVGEVVRLEHPQALMFYSAAIWTSKDIRDTYDIVITTGRMGSSGRGRVIDGYGNLDDAQEDLESLVRAKIRDGYQPVAPAATPQTPRPPSAGDILELVYLENTSGKASKFWEGYVVLGFDSAGGDVYSFRVRFGRIGTSGQNKLITTSFGRVSAANALRDKVREKKSKGYVELDPTEWDSRWGKPSFTALPPQTLPKYSTQDARLAAELYRREGLAPMPPPVATADTPGYGKRCAICRRRRQGRVLVTEGALRGQRVCFTCYTPREEITKDDPARATGSPSTTPAEPPEATYTSRRRFILNPPTKKG